MCIYLNDEMGFCCKDKGIDFEHSKNNKRCLDWKEPCPDKITVADVKNLQLRLAEAGKMLKYFKDLLIDAYPCLGNCRGDYCEDFAPTACPAVQAKLYWDKHKTLLHGEAEKK